MAAQEFSDFPKRLDESSQGFDRLLTLFTMPSS
jgi:hypothetical protein